MFHLAITVGYLYLLWRFVWPLPLRMSVKTTIAIVLLLVSQYHLLLKLAFGNMFSPEMPRLLIVIAAGLFCFFVLLLMLMVVSDALKLLWLLCMRRRLTLCGRGYALTLSMVATVLTVTGVQQALRVPKVKELSVTLPNLAPQYDGIRMVQLTDLHISQLFNRPWVDTVVSKTNALQPDLIVITGDLIDGTVEHRTNEVAPLRLLSAPLGVYASLGNHEYYFDAAHWADRFEQLGMTVLQNSSITIPTVGINLAGVTDEAAAAFGLPPPDLTQALSNIDHTLPTVLLKHQPINALMSSEHGVSLQLSGQTHGGMIKGLDLLLSGFNQGFMSGQFQLGDMTLYVSNGTALWNGFPIRLGVPAEITVLTLHSPSK
ncbi:metallophosphoesterase [Shewanella sp. Shew256]|uniref:metallophosphoesterase n=1 Tax=Shewanella sp. Shew256 TaxID=1969376 RepID=UPI000B4994F9|nr:metallophosphoesterase [Shewanella sp. Shew256]